MKHRDRGGWTCLPCANARSKAYRADNPAKWADTRLWTFYRIRLADFEAMAAAQGGLCAACGEAPPDRERSATGGKRGGWSGGLVVDHDHATGKVRGLLCAPCNVTLGMASDSAARLRAAAAYLEAHGGR